MVENTQDSSNESAGVVLIIDDNSDILEVLTEIIEIHTNFSTLTANSGKDGLEILKQQSVDVIILDFLMPVMTGLELLKVIRDRSIKTPVIMLTGKGDEAKKQEAFDSGVFDFLNKPVKARDLLILVDEAHKVNQQVQAILAKKKEA